MSTSALPPLTVEARDVVRVYGERRALDGLSLAIPAGSVFGLLGPNGSGKSTCVSLLAAMAQPDEGVLRVFGQQPCAALRARVGTVFQENAQDPLLSCSEYLALAGRLFGVPRAKRKARTGALLATFGLAERSNEPIANLSGGMRRRLDMARALLHEPELLILDEPTTGVDPDERRALWAALLGSERGTRTILLATNDLSEADAVCDRVAFLRDGRVIATGTPAELKRNMRRDALRLVWNASDEQLAEIASWPGIGDAGRDGDALHLTVDDATAFVPRLFSYAPGEIRSVSIQPATLEDAYFQHVGSRLQPAGGAP